MWAQAGDVSNLMTGRMVGGLSLVGAVTLVVVVWIVARTYKQVQKLRLATALRQDVLKDLLARGLCQLHPTSAPAAPVPRPDPQHAFTTL